PAAPVTAPFAAPITPVPPTAVVAPPTVTSTAPVAALITPVLPTPTPPPTGRSDGSSIASWIALAVAVLAGTGILGARRRSR
ncbi:MAG: LPXTG cell wall anchor domain-containing protein, partial [Chloroflexota bacterium]|nr:LPXTG cell wall anchor domain-containing protein [Chloroflexota bacterium]